MSRLLTLLSGYALPIVTTVLVLVGATAIVQTYRVDQLHQENGRLTEQINSAVRANESNQQTIKSLVTTAKANADQFERALQDQAEAATRIEYLTTQIREQADDDITAIQNTDDACGLSPMPDDTRMRLDPRRDRDGGSPGDSGAPGADRPGTDPRADRT